MENEIFRVFIFDSNEGTLLSQEDYINFTEIQKEIITWNQANQNNRKNIYIGTQFPPPGVKFNKQIKQFVATTLSEQVASGEVILPPDSKLVGETVVKLTKKELFEKGLLTLEYNEKIDDFDNIVKMNVLEMFEQEKANRYQVFEYFFAKITSEVDKVLKKYHNYPIHEMNSWEMKKNQSIGWLQLPNEEKIVLLTGEKTGIALYQLLVSETLANKDITNLSDDEKIETINTQAEKIVTRFRDLEIIYAELFAKKNAKKEKLKTLMNSDLSSKEMIKAMEDVVNE